MGPFDIAAMGVLTGLIFVIGALTVVLVIVLMQLRNRRARTEMLHQERMLAIEKGMPMPQDLMEPVKRRRPYVRGMVFAAIGLGLMVMGSLDSGDTDLIGIGVIFLLVGGALILGDFITQRRAETRRELMPPLPEIDRPYRTPENPS